MSLIGTLLKCRGCHKNFKLGRNEHKRQFCTRVCYNKNRFGENNPRWKGGKERHPNCANCGRKLSYTSKRITSTPQMCHTCRCDNWPWGKESPNWTGYGTSGKSSKDISETWKKRLLKRDKRCLNCGESRRVLLQGCHLKSRAQFPELAIDLDNGVILCANCHLLLDNNIIKFTYPYRQLDCKGK